MRAKILLVIFVLLSILLAGCDDPATPLAPLGGAQIATPAPTAVPTQVPAVSLEERLYKEEAFSFTIPAGWGMTAREGEYYDLGMQEKFTAHNAPLITDSGAFFTLSTAQLAEGEDLESRIASAYAVQMTGIEDLAQQPYEREGLSGYEATYRRPWGEPWWRFRDIWLEKEGTSYLLSFSSSPYSFDSNAEVFDGILASFRFND